MAIRTTLQKIKNTEKNTQIRMSLLTVVFSAVIIMIYFNAKEQSALHNVFLTVFSLYASLVLQ